MAVAALAGRGVAASALGLIAGAASPVATFTVGRFTELVVSFEGGGT
ncbi:MAG: hypothetical protein Rhirs2KO_27510 [Rhizobiaceae bacterium]